MMMPQTDIEDIGEMPHVCPGCHAIGEEPHVPGCIDGELEEEHRHAIESGDYDEVEDGEWIDLNDAEDWEWEP